MKGRQTHVPIRRLQDVSQKHSSAQIEDKSYRILCSVYQRLIQIVCRHTQVGRMRAVLNSEVAYNRHSITATLNIASDQSVR